MYQVLIIIGIMVVAAVVIYFARKYIRGPVQYKDEMVHAFVSIGVDKKYWTPQHTYTTAGGVPVESADPIPTHALQELENGISNQIRLYTEQNPNWTAGRLLTDYRVMVIKQMGLSSGGQPVMYVKGTPSAGTVIGCNERLEQLSLKPIVVIVSQHEQNWEQLEYFRHSAHAESEHAREYYCRRMEPTGVFYYWAHVGDTHPHTAAGWGDAAVGLKSPAPVPCVLGVEIPKEITPPPSV